MCDQHFSSNENKDSPERREDFAMMYSLDELISTSVVEIRHTLGLQLEEVEPSTDYDESPFPDASFTPQEPIPYINFSSTISLSLLHPSMEEVRVNYTPTPFSNSVSSFYLSSPESIDELQALAEEDIQDSNEVRTHNSTNNSTLYGDLLVPLLSDMEQQVSVSMAIFEASRRAPIVESNEYSLIPNEDVDNTSPNSPIASLAIFETERIVDLSNELAKLSISISTFHTPQHNEMEIFEIITNRSFE